jgi:hypothetical protein
MGREKKSGAGRDMKKSGGCEIFFTRKARRVKSGFRIEPKNGG